MKLFGSKDNDDGLNEGLEDDAFDAGFDTDVEGALDLDADMGGDGGELSAPSREFGDGKKSRKGLLAVLLLLLAGGGAGGYYYLNMMGSDAPLNTSASNVNPNVNAQTAAVVGLDVPPMPQPMTDASIPQANIGLETPDPFAAIPTAAPIDMPGFDTPEDGVSIAAVEAPDMASIAAPADIIDPFAVMGAPPAADETIAAAPADDFQVVDAPVEFEAPIAAADTQDATPPETMPQMPADIPGDLPIGEPAVTANASQEAAPVEAAPDFAEMAERTAETPVEDLPMPNMTDIMPAPAPDVVTEAAVDPAAATGEIATVNTKTPAPTAAEKAIVENAAMLDQLSAPAPATAQDPAARGKTANEILGEPAIVRRLPDTYLVVRKDHASGDLDTRLKVARVALMEKRFSAAAQLFDELQTDYPRDERITMGRALSMQQMGRGDEALVAYEGILGANPKNLEALTNMLGLLKVSNPALAVEKLEELRTVYPYNADIAAQLGVSYAGLKNYEAAMQYLDMADALEPNNAYVYYNKAVLFDRLGQQNMAATMYRHILQLHAEGRLSDPLPMEAIRRRLSSMR